MENYELLIC